MKKKWTVWISGKGMQRLYFVVMRVVAVPATSAPVERVFSHGGLIMRPHQAMLNARTLSKLDLFEK